LTRNELILCDFIKARNYTSKIVLFIQERLKELELYDMLTFIRLFFVVGLNPLEIIEII